jgi:undecaprenyl-diphosphatase
MAEHPERKAGTVLLLALAAAIVALVLFAWLAGEVFAGGTAAFDAMVRRLVHQEASPSLTRIMRFFTELGEVRSLVVLGAGVLAALLASGMPRAAWLFGITMAGAGALNATLKLAFRRTRPEAFFGTALPDSYSFPSGHALLSVCFFGFIAAVLTSRLRNRAAQFAVWAATCVTVLLIGFSRIYLGVHYPTDVVAGYAAAVFWVGAVVWGDHLLRRRRIRTKGEAG